MLKYVLLVSLTFSLACSQIPRRKIFDPDRFTFMPTATTPAPTPAPTPTYDVKSRLDAVIEIIKSLGSSPGSLTPNAIKQKLRNINTGLKRVSGTFRTTLRKLTSPKRDLSGGSSGGWSRDMRQKRQTSCQDDLLSVKDEVVSFLLRISYLSEKLDNPDSITDAWANAVISEGDDGLPHIMSSLHKLITGTFMPSTRRFLDVYLTKLISTDNPDVWGKMDELITSLIDMQEAGYMSWGYALYQLGLDAETVELISVIGERSLIQQNILNFDQRLKVWPSGSYGLVKAASGCPKAEGTWYEGWRYHDTEDSRPSNQASPSYTRYADADVPNNNLKWKFCMKNGNPQSTQWQSGRYCVFAKTTSCPIGLTRGNIYFNDQDDVSGGWWRRGSRNTNDKGGAVPDGEYGKDTKYFFCCKTDGPSSTELVLPIADPFVLFPYGSYGCPKVKNMKATMFWFKWDCENRHRVVRNSSPYPKSQQDGNIRIYMCHYEVVECPSL